MKRALVFGCCGFIGSRLSQHLRRAGWRVTGADVLAPAHEIVDEFAPSDNGATRLGEVFGTPFDVCVNCAGNASVPLSYEDPVKDYTLNSHLVFRILAAIRQTQPCCRFVNLSSAAVYGNPLRLPVSEGEPARPISPYGVHKHVSELICGEFRDCFGLQTTSLRVFSAYGPGLRKQLFWDLFRKARDNEEIELFGTGHETRDFIYIDDLVRAIELVIQAEPWEHPAINVATGQETTIEDVARVFCREFPEPRRFRFNDHARKGDPSRWVGDVDLLRNLGFEPRVSVDEGIRKYIRWAGRDAACGKRGRYTEAA
ncbi:MAG: NAD-dependent epimerase/dehydratase family protein [Planctomycetes bacterium]|nr:NAD-dependent epimerase/dehydratase family protein [Planctomycetota bacterium]